MSVNGTLTPFFPNLCYSSLKQRDNVQAIFCSLLCTADQCLLCSVQGISQKKIICQKTQSKLVHLLLIKCTHNYNPSMKQNEGLYFHWKECTRSGHKLSPQLVISVTYFLMFFFIFHLVPARSVFYLYCQVSTHK